MTVPVQQLKASLRSKIKNKLSLLSKEYIQDCSVNLTQQLLASPFYAECSRISVYLSLPDEVQTIDIIKDIFAQGKECFIPRYTKDEMAMVKLYSLEDYEKLPLTKWNIKQPSLSEEREDSYLRGGLDLVLVPGLCFTTSGHRLGRGKGYYDKYLQELKKFREKSNIKPAITVALAFSEQIVESIPVSSHDFIVDYVLYPNKVGS